MNNIKNCLTFCLEFKKRFPDSVIKMEIPKLYQEWKSLITTNPILSIRYIRYLNSIGYTYFFLFFVPHFYAIYNNTKYHYIRYQGSKKRYIIRERYIN